MFCSRRAVVLQIAISTMLENLVDKRGMAVCMCLCDPNRKKPKAFPCGNVTY